MGRAGHSRLTPSPRFPPRPSPSCPLLFLPQHLTVVSSCQEFTAVNIQPQTSILNPQSLILNPQPSTQNTQHRTLHHKPYTLHLTVTLLPDTGLPPAGCICLPTPPSPYTLHPRPYTLHPTPYTLHPTPYTLHSTPYTIHPTPYTLHPTPCTLHPAPYPPSPHVCQGVHIVSLA